MSTPPCPKLRSPSEPQEHPHGHRGGLWLPLFSRVLVLFWMLAAQCLRADVCDVRVGVIVQGRPDALAQTDRIIAGLSIPGFVFLNRTDGAPPQETGVDYLVFVIFFDPSLGGAKVRLMDVTTAGSLAATEPASDEAMLAWIRQTVPEKAVPFRLPGRGEGPPVELEAGGCTCLYYSVDAAQTRLAVRSGYGWLLAAPSPAFPWPWRRYDSAPTFEWASASDGKPFHPNGEPNAVSYYAPPFTAGLRDTVQFLAYCPKDPDENTRLSPVRVALVPPKVTVLATTDTSVAVNRSIVTEVDPAGGSRIVESWTPNADRGEKGMHVFRCPPSAKKRVVWVSLEIQDSCGDDCTFVTMIGKTRSGRSKTHVWKIPLLDVEFQKRWVSVEAIAGDLYQVESIEITSFEGFYRNLNLGWATWDCPDSALRYLPADGVLIGGDRSRETTTRENTPGNHPAESGSSKGTGTFSANALTHSSADLAPGPGFSHTGLSIWDFSKANSASFSASPTNAPSPGPSPKPGTARAQSSPSPTRASD
ncbi:MAG: hypothetical protein ACKOKG_10810 [Verrucomicrobiota bacterium]